MPNKQSKLIYLHKQRKISELVEEIQNQQVRIHKLWQIVKKQQKIILKLEKNGRGHR